MKPLLVDDLDRQIISLMRENPRITNREVGDRVGQSERLVASRIAALQANDIMRVVVQRDVASLGDDLLGLVNIFVQGRDVRDVAQEIREIEEVSSLVLLLGPPQLAAMVHARDREHLHELISGCRLPKLLSLHRSVETVPCQNGWPQLEVRGTADPARRWHVDAAITGEAAPTRLAPQLQQWRWR